MNRLLLCTLVVCAILTLFAFVALADGVAGIEGTVYLQPGQTLTVQVDAAWFEWTLHGVATDTAVPRLYTPPGAMPGRADLYETRDGDLIGILEWQR